MADRGKYVDIFFRNGLREFEVLPPPDVWDNIKPVIRKKQKSLTLLRFAAFAAILVSMTVFSLWLTNEISNDFRQPGISLNQDISPPGFYVAEIKPAASKLIGIPYRNSGIENPVEVTEPVSPEELFLKIPSTGLFTTALMERKLHRGFENTISRDRITGVSNSPGIENLYLEKGNQVSLSPENDVNRFTISAMASPNFYSSISFGKNAVSQELLDFEEPAVSYSGGMVFSYMISKRISIQSGVYYSSVGQKVSGISSYSGFHKYYNAKSGSQFSINTSSGVIVSSNNDIFLRDNNTGRVQTKYTIDYFDPRKTDLTYLNSSIIQNFNYLEIPFIFKVKAIDQKIDLNFIGGLSYNLLIGNSVFSYVDGERYFIGKTEGLSPVNFTSSLGLGFEYNLSENISLNIEPTFRYYLTPLSGLAGSSIHPYSFGVFSGLSYKF
ncbi:MAG: hypothetical protein C0408_00280 [Odoribacter sp.]|nr:hypothetical protein [Odoribacter sp.]